MGLITLVLLVCITGFYFSKLRESKSEDPLRDLVKKSDGYLQKIDAFFEKTLHCDALTVFFIYGIIGALFTVLMPLGFGGLLIRLFANILIVLMLLPFVVGKIADKYGEKLNAAILQEMSNLGGWVDRHKKYFAFGGAGIAVLLFAILFK